MSSLVTYYASVLQTASKFYRIESIPGYRTLEERLYIRTVISDLTAGR